MKSKKILIVDINDKYWDELNAMYDSNNDGIVTYREFGDC